MAEVVHSAIRSGAFLDFLCEYDDSCRAGNPKLLVSPAGWLPMLHMYHKPMSQLYHEPMYHEPRTLTGRQDAIRRILRGRIKSITLRGDQSTLTVRAKAG